MSELHLTDRLTGAVGAKTARVLEAELGLRTVADLVHHYPRRYAERGKLMAFADLVLGEHATVLAEVVRCSDTQVLRRPGRGQMRKTDVTLRDDDGRHMRIAIFGKWNVQRQLRPGRRALFSGKVTRFRGDLQLQSPDYILIDRDEAGDEDEVAAHYAGALIPVYPATAKADSDTLARSVEVVLSSLVVTQDPLPEALRREHDLVDLMQALRLIHRPADHGERARARCRLVWDEALVLQVVLAQRRAAALRESATPRPGRPDGLLAAFDAMTPFVRTDGQVEVGEVLAAELARDQPMLRLLQGEVGSGKTLVALRAMLAVIDSGGQAALLAPTEVLAQQHARSLSTLLGPLAMDGELGAAEQATRIALLTGSLGAAARREALEQVAGGQAGLVVGTHALLSEGVEFQDLGLVVVDEQHRFGVDQREALRAKGVRESAGRKTAPHVLVMTATPIPRTVAMTVFGDLEVCTLTELPRGRAPIASHVVPRAEQPAWLERAWQRVLEAVRDGRQAYVVCPRVGGESADESRKEGEPRPAAAVEDVLPVLEKGALAGLRLAALHGKMPAEAKESAMRDFVAGHTEVLVATTVIEVGVDVPNATVMVILDADRFGISQLHQLRGRIGRGEHAGLCLLVTDAEQGSPARTRLDAVAATSDGFALAQLDLEQRREGDVLGQAQSGRRSHVRLLELARDEQVILSARAEAARLVEQDPDLLDHQALAEAVQAVLDPDRAEFLERT